jgi:hypothetical protein
VPRAVETGRRGGQGSFRAIVQVEGRFSGNSIPQNEACDNEKICSVRSCSKRSRNDTD